MWKALARKELREIAGIAALAAMAFVAVDSGVAGAVFFSWLPVFSEAARSVPFVDSSFLTCFSLVALALAMALALRQSAWEWGRHTYLFLLHRPIARFHILLVKMATGLAALMLLSAASILALAIWAATPGTHPAPFEWSMTVDSWRTWLGFSVVYLGAFLRGVRSGRWFGTRLLPLAAGVAVFTGLALSSLAIPIAIVLTLAIDGLFLIAIRHVAENQDYS